MIIILLNFILFPTALWVISVVFSWPLLLSLVVGLVLAVIAPVVRIVTNKDTAIRWLKSLTIVVLGGYAMLLFISIGNYLLLQGQAITISTQLLSLSALLIFALFIYYILLTQTKIQKAQSLDQQLNQVLLRPSILLCLLVACILTVLELLLLTQLADWLSWIAPKLLERGIIPPLTLLLFNWGLLLLLGKWLILLKEGAKNKHSLLLLMQQKYSNDFWDKVWLKSDAFYILPNYINYALPVLGFIGTVLGISLSAEGIANIIASPEGLSSANQSLGDAIAPLGIAFDTTLIALSLGLVLTLIFVLLQSMEVRILNKLKQLANEYKD